MISGKFLGKEFKIADGDIECKDSSVKEKLEKVQKGATMDKGPGDGDPEYWFYIMLETCGAENLKYENDEQEDVIY